MHFCCWRDSWQGIWLTLIRGPRCVPLRCPPHVRDLGMAEPLAGQAGSTAKGVSGLGQVLLTLSEDNEQSSRTLPPSELPSARQERLLGLWGLPPPAPPPTPRIQNPLLGPEAAVSPQGLWLLLEGRSPRAEGWRPGTPLAEAADAKGWASRASPA